jgi:hypothetical protein
MKKPASPAKRPQAANATRLTVSLPEFLVDGSDLQFRGFVADLFAAVAGMQSLRRALANAAEMSAAEFSILLATWNLQAAGRVSVSTIANHLHIASAHVVTHAGEAVLNALAPLLRRINDRLFAGNSPQALRAISRFLRHLATESSTSIRMAQDFRR